MKIKLHLSNGKEFVAEYEEDAYDDIYDLWIAGGITPICFENGIFRAMDILGMEYME